MEHLRIIDPPLLQFRTGKISLDPVAAFARDNLQPFYSPSFSSPLDIWIMVPAKYGETSSAVGILNDLKTVVEGQYARSKYKPFARTFGFDLDVKKAENYSGINEIYNKINSIEQSRKPAVIVIVAEEHSAIGGFYYEVKMHSISKSVQTQILLQRTVSKYRDLNLDKRADFLWNFSLSIFSKAKGIPWKFQSALKDVAAFVSLCTVASHEVGITTRNGIASFEIANAWGEFAGRFFAKNVEMERDEGITKVSIESLKVLLESTLDRIVSILVDPEKSREEEYLIFHLSDRYASNVYSAIEEVVGKKSFKKYKILHIQEEGALRLYDPTQSTARRWPLEGSYWFLEKNIAFLYTLGRWKFTNSEPYIIGASNLSPIQVNFVKGSRNSGLSIDDLAHVYHLTRFHYYTAEIQRIKMPATITFGRKAAHLVASGLNVSDYDISYLY